MHKNFGVVVLIILIGVSFLGIIILDSYGRSEYMVLFMIVVGVLFSFIWGIKRGIENAIFKHKYRKKHETEPLLKTYVRKR